jgi:hypothetical protein
MGKSKHLPIRRAKKYHPYYKPELKVVNELDIQANLLSEDLSEYSEIINPTQLQKQQFEQTARQHYEEIIKLTQWKQLLILTAEKLVKDLKLENHKQSNTEFTIAVNNKIIKINDKVFTIGRASENDIQLTDDCISRLHIIVFVLPFNLVVVDLASFIGTKTISRSSNKTLKHSEPNERNILIFDRGETVELKLADDQIVLFPKECVVCMNKSRSITLGCGHYALCKDCYEKIKNDNNECPLCRKFIVSVEYDGVHHHTNIF